MNFILTILVGLTAGLMFGFSTSVIPGLAQVSDENYIRSMKSINRKIQNLLFFIVFIGPVFLFIINLFINFNPFNLATAGLYVLGVFGVTIAGNVPINEKVEKFNIEKSSPKELKFFRKESESKWNRLHTIRTIFSMICFIILVIL